MRTQASSLHRKDAEPRKVEKERLLQLQSLEEPMDRDMPNPASNKEKAEGSRENVAPDAMRDTEKHLGERRAQTSEEPMEGRIDSGVDPEVHNREIPPQE
jgi:hypothetical protein